MQFPELFQCQMIVKIGSLFVVDWTMDIAS